MPNMSKSWKVNVTSLAMALALFAPSALAQDIKTLEPGKLAVAFNGDMPGTEWVDGKLGGVDGEILQRIAERLKLQVTPAPMEWSAAIAATQGGRVDAMLGMMNWRQARAEVMDLSDPIYYTKATVAQREGQNWCKLADLEGQTIGTITGFAWVDELKAIKGTKLKLYDTSDAAMRDLVSGRISALMADPPLVQYAISKNPAWGVHQIAFCEKERDDFPQLTKVANVVIATTKSDGSLSKAINAEIRDMWGKCEMKAIAAKYGLTQEDWFKPGASTRVGVDRPEDWTQPTCQ